MHRAVGNRVHILRRSRAQNFDGVARAGRARVERRERHVGQNRQSRTARAGEIRNPFIHSDAVNRVAVFVGAKLADDFRQSRGRRHKAVDVAGQGSARSVVDCADVEINRSGGRVARERFFAVLRKNTQAEKCRSGDVELVESHMICVRPDADFRIIVKGIRRVCVAPNVISARRVARLRERDTLISLVAGWHAELTDVPAVGERVVKNNRVAVVVHAARVACGKRSENRIGFDRSR